MLSFSATSEANLWIKPFDQVGPSVSSDITIPCASGNILTSSGGGVWACAAGGGSGDITSVGDVASGAAFDGTQGTTLTFFNAGGNATVSYDGTNMASSKAVRLGGSTGGTVNAATGVFTLAGIGNTNNENVTVDLEGTSNTAVWSSGTGVTRHTFTGASLSASGNSSNFGSGSSATAGFTIVVNGGQTSTNAAVAGVSSTHENTNTGTSTASTGMTGLGIISGAQAAAIARGGSFTGRRTTNTGGNSQTLRGLVGTADYQGTGTQTDAIGVHGLCQKTTSASGAITDCYSFFGSVPTTAGGGTITNSWGYATDGVIGFTSALGTTPDTTLSRSAASTLTTNGKFTSTATADVGWSVQAAANQACNTTCTNACVFGEDAGTAGVLNSSIVSCSDATADKCVCAGAS